LFNFPQISQVDPIVASFSGGAVGVISALMLIEANNVEQQEKKRCKYCHGTGMVPMNFLISTFIWYVTILIQDMFLSIK
jgi:hypothetical protein